MIKVIKRLKVERIITFLTVILMLILATFISSCKKYLDVVPDDVVTLDNAFKLRSEAEKFLFTCYSSMPHNGERWNNPGMFTDDELWFPQNEQTGWWDDQFRIALGRQNVGSPLFNTWANGYPNKVWVGVRNCNTFLENVYDLSKIPDLTPAERSRWIGEGLFLKGYFLFYMLRMYGPIPLMDKNIPVDATGADAFSKRIPVDSCVHYISNLLDSAINRLPARIVDENKELGRITQPIALAVKARLWMMAASPLFNGNPDFTDFKDKEGTALFDPTYDAGKWAKARDAVKAAIDAAEANNFGLYVYTNDIYNLSDATKTQLNIRNAVTEPWNREIVWGNSQSYFITQSECMPPLQRGSITQHFILQGIWAPPIKIAKLFYTKNGVPIDEDKTLNFSKYNELRTAADEDRYYVEPGFSTARLNFDREPRFYADLGFDGSIWYQKDGNDIGSDTNTFYIKCKNGDIAGFGDFRNWSETGYFVKKLVNWQSTTRGTSNPGWKDYPWPEMRMADLYLLYAEAMNEVEPASPIAIQYLDKVRARAGLKGIVESWTTYSNNPSKYTTQEGLRKIIHQERSIELMFEGQRLWDLKRWKEADAELNKNITGWSITSNNNSGYYQERTVYNQSFIAPRDYFWPIGNYDTRRNANLVENLGW